MSGHGADQQFFGRPKQIDAWLKLVRYLQGRFHITTGNVIAHAMADSSLYFRDHTGAKNQLHVTDLETGQATSACRTSAPTLTAASTPSRVRRGCEASRLAKNGAPSRVTGGLIVVRDVTAYRVAEAEVRRLNEDLEERSRCARSLSVTRSSAWARCRTRWLVPKTASASGWPRW
jgi:hypothetical protein